MKRRAQKKKENRIIKLYEPLFENMLGPVVQIAEGFSPSEYRTTEARIKANLEKQFEDNRSGEQLAKALIELIATIDIQGNAKEMERGLQREVSEHIKKDKRFDELYRLVKAAEQKHKNISCIFFLQGSPLETVAKAFEPYDLIEELSKLKGEKSARATVRIFREVVELLYVEYVNAIYGFVQVLEEKKQIKLKGKFGNLAKQLPERLAKLGFSNLVDTDAGWLRNAACHGRWIYKSETDTIALWDLKKPVQQFTAEELFLRAMNMYEMVINNYLPMIMIYLKNQILTTEWINIMKYLQRNLKALMVGGKVENEQINKYINEEFGHLARLNFE